MREEGPGGESGKGHSWKRLLGPRGPVGGGAQLSLGRGWQGPLSRGSLERGHRRADRAQLWRPSGMAAGMDFVPSRPHSTPSLHLLSSFICSFSTYSPCATFGPRPGRQELSGSACSHSSKQQLDQAGGQQRTSAQDAPCRGSSALLGILTEPWLGDDFADLAWRGCRAKAFPVPPALWAVET